MKLFTSKQLVTMADGNDCDLYGVNEGMGYVTLYFVDRKTKTVIADWESYDYVGTDIRYFLSDTVAYDNLERLLELAKGGISESGCVVDKIALPAFAI